MKQLFRIFTLLITCLITMSAFAQTWTPSSVGEGTFYLYSVSEGKFLTAGTLYGTRASLTKQGGIPLTFTAVDVDNGIYSISSAPTFTNRFMGIGLDGNEAYFDITEGSSSSYSNWKFIAVEGETNTYLIQAVKNSKYMVAHATKLDRTSVISTDIPTTNKGYWKLVSKDALIDNLANATAENPIDATFTVLNHTFSASSASIPRWTGEYTAWGGIDDNKCVEQWNRTFDMSQTITGLPNGVYSMLCQGFYRMGGGGNDASKAATARNNGTEELHAKYYINGTEGSLKSILDYSRAYSNNSTYNTSSAVTVGGRNVYVPNTLDRASACLRDGEYLNEPIQAVVTDGTLKIGFRKSVAATNDWAAYDNVVLTYYGMDLSALVTTYEKLLSEAKTIQGQPMQASAKNNLDEAITMAETNVNTSSQTWLETIISVLNTAIDAARSSNANYTGVILTAVNNMKVQSTSESVKAELQTLYETGGYTSVADVYTTYQRLEVASLTPVAGTSYTSVIINPSFELGNMVGWNTLDTGGDTGVFRTNNSTYSFSGTLGDWLFNTWDQGVKTLDIGQTVTGLPRGYYTLSAIVASFGDGSTIILTANGSTSKVNPTDVNDVDGHKKIGHTLALENIFVSDGTLSFRLLNTGKNETLLKADDFQLTYTAPYEPPTVFTDLVYTFNVENDEVASYLANTTYDESTATAIPNYSTEVALRNDQPTTIRIPLPEQTTDATLSLALSSDYAGAETHTISAGNIFYEIKNLMPQHTYYYKVETDNGIIASGTITTTGRLRMMKSEGISNMRDMGGWINADGNRIRYGKIYRGSELVGGKTYTASTADLQMLADLDIAAEVDLRENADFASGLINISAIRGATYYYANLNRWGEDALNLDNSKFKDGFDLILAALKAGHAAYFHCIFGADRTGCFAFLLEGLLGVPIDQLYKDYELTSFSSAGVRRKADLDQKLHYINALQGESLQQKFYNYWRGAVGVSEADLNDFIRIMVDGSSPVTTTPLADLPTKAVEDGEYYLYIPALRQFVGRGDAYGTRGVAEGYGVPIEIRTNGANVSTIRCLDNNLYLGSDGFTDKGANYKTVSWTVERCGEGVVLKSHSGNYLRIDESGLARVDASTLSEATPIALKSVDEQRAIVAVTRQGNILDAASKVGITASTVDDFATVLATDFIPVASKASIKSANAGSTSNWPLTQPSLITSTSSSGYNVGSYGGELYQCHGYIAQTVIVPHAGLYKLTLHALYRQGTNEICYSLGQKGYELSNAYVSINDEYFAQIPSWYSDAAGNSNPNNTDQASALIGEGKYTVEVWAYIGREKLAKIRIYVPGYTPYGWCLFNNFTLTEYAKKMTISEDDIEALTPCDCAHVTLQRTLVGGQWNGFSLPFTLTATQIATSPLKGAVVKQFASADDHVITLSNATRMVAGEPYFVKPENTIENPVFTGVTVTNPTEAVKGDGDYRMAAHLYNTSLATDGSVAYISTTDGSIKKLTSGEMMGLNAYFLIPTGDDAKDLVVKFEETDGIITIDNGQKTKDNDSAVFNLAGQRLQQPRRGVNIMNGKKIIMK
ncbi:MAG: tyrosine-protein phosphatase [Prevotella sp.]|nr:tyrosine-protein phosphatase [Prevotella sp.]